MSFISIWKWSKIPRECIFWSTKYLLCRTASSGLQAHDSDFECVSMLHLLTVSAIKLDKGKETRNYKQTEATYISCNIEQKTTIKTIYFLNSWISKSQKKNFIPKGSPKQLCTCVQPLRNRAFSPLHPFTSASIPSFVIWSHQERFKCSRFLQPSLGELEKYIKLNPAFK